MTEFQGIRARACAILTVLFGVSSIVAIWLAMFTEWPTVIRWIILSIFHLFLCVRFVVFTSTIIGSKNENIKPVEEKNT